MDEEIKVGDEVQFYLSNTKFVVTSIDSHTGAINGIGAKGIAFTDKKAENWNKTGKHYDLLEKAMKQIERECR